MIVLRSFNLLEFLKETQTRTWPVDDERQNDRWLWEAKVLVEAVKWCIKGCVHRRTYLASKKSNLKTLTKLSTQRGRRSWLREISVMVKPRR
jgi:hypothetical protein